VKPVILIAGGGTGGHVFPAVAVAEAAQRMADVDVVFIGTDRGVEARVIPGRGWRLEVLHVEPMKGGGLSRAIRGGIIAAKATVRAARVVRALQPEVVLSVGGYAAGPAALAAAIIGVPVALLEANSTVGLANRLLAPLAKRAFVAWNEATPAFRAGVVRRYGVPLRTGFAPRPLRTGRARARILVMGGSQGAAVLNERVPEAIARLVGEGRALEVVHQAGRDREAGVRDAYARLRVEHVTVVPFVDDVARAITEADLVVARAGAGTIAEITAIGRPSILVPFPHAADDHQGKNAEALARAGASVCLRQERADVPRIASEIERLLSDDALRRHMADVATAIGRPQAAKLVAKDLLALAGIEPRVSLSAHDDDPASMHDDPRRWN
jgi:UDP-N-acetylglucosamine--N-acetylmuramyl-(pentapeptide) pyrophosphoryl-undecaprenol N-acetylglucosamine transferase